MAWQNIPNNQYWQYDDAPLDPGGAETALWETSTNGVRTSVRGEQIYVNCRHTLLHPTQDSFPNEINKTFWIGVEPTGIILIDGFGTLELVANNTDLDDAGGTAWYNQDGTTDGEAFAGTMTSTTLTMDNTPVYDPNSRFFETPTARIINNTASGSTISFSFDYNVSAGSPSIYFHLKGVDVTGASPVWNQQLLGRGGAAFVTDSVDLASNNTDTYNLFNGNLSDGGFAADAYNVGNTNVTGTGTISATIDLSGHATYQDLSDYEYLAAAFAFDFDEAAAIEISNFSVTSVP